MWLRSEAAKRYIESLGLMSLLCLLLLGYRMLDTDTTRYWFIPWNLLLAWAGLFFGWLLANQLRVRRWLSWQNIILSILWLAFLPNTWYVITDFLHVYPTGEISELYDILLVGTTAFSGFILGFTSLRLIHNELLERLSPRASWTLVEAAILLSSFAIYLGRVLRWNSWDIVTNPGGLIVNVSDRIADPLGNPHALNMTGLFFVTLSIAYLAFYRGTMVLTSGRSGR